jgi:predicted nucleic-acid-binding protein
MKKIVVDINVLLDWLHKRRDYQTATAVVDLCSIRAVKGFLCAHEITTLSYFLDKQGKHPDKILKAIAEIFDIFEIIEDRKSVV